LVDNSLFWHVRTGVDMVRTGGIPRTDPYSFTAAGDPWVVQSWLAELSYGVADRLGGLAGVRVEQGILYALLGWMTATLCRTGVAWRTALAATIATSIGVRYWAPRPLAFGLVCLGATVLIVERRKSPWLLVPLVWLWANTHGSFVLGLGWLVLLAIGHWLDRGRAAAAPSSTRRGWTGLFAERTNVALLAFAIGLAVACINPLGPRLLVFPLTVATKAEAFRQVAEWRSPSFQSSTELLTLAGVIGTIVVLARARDRLKWADLLPVAGFLGVGLAAQRNLPMAAIVIAPVLARALRPGATLPTEATEPAAERRPSIHLGFAAVLVVLGAFFVVAAAASPALSLRGYPVVAARLLPGGARVATTDVAAGYLILARRPVRVLIDDRVDLYALGVTADYIRLLDGHPAGLRILDRYDADAVLWPADGPLESQLAASNRWRRVGAAEGWVVYLRR
jgi:hypothetical protein